MRIDLYQLPSDIDRHKLVGSTSVAVDVLRAGTTITSALDSGARGILSCIDIETAREHASLIDDALLGGERQGVLIEGFDLSNSPAAYRAEVVSGRTIIFTTTNGTLAIEASRESDETLIGSFVNFSAVCSRLEKSGRDVSIVCAGTDGQPTLEDVLFGGALCSQLSSERSVRLNTAAHAATEIWQAASRKIEAGKSLFEILCETQGGKNLCQLELHSDIEFAATVNRFHLVPVLERATGIIRSDVDLAASHG